MSKSPPTSRVIAILEALAGNPSPLPSSEVARLISASTSTTALVLETLQTASYVERLPDKSYVLGSGILRLLSGLQRKYPILGAANEELAGLHRDLGLGCTLARVERDGQEVVLTAGPTERLGIIPGVKLPLTPPIGSIAMAWRSPEEIEKWLKANGSPVADKPRQIAMVKNIRELGYAVYGIDDSSSIPTNRVYSLLSNIGSLNKREYNYRMKDIIDVIASRVYSMEDMNHSAIMAVSHIISPIFWASGQPAYLLSVHVMKEAVPRQELDAHVQRLLQSAARLTDSIGGKIPRQSRIPPTLPDTPNFAGYPQLCRIPPTLKGAPI